MTSRDFCFWLQGYFEIHGNRPVQEPDQTYNLNESQIEMIKKHLSLVFKHEIDPSMGDKTVQDALNSLHGYSKPEKEDIRPSHSSPYHPYDANPLIRC